MEIKEVILNGLPKDTLLVFLRAENDTLNIFREIEIVENEIKDTVSLGYSIIPPGFTGKIRFSQNGLDKSSAVYLIPSWPLNPDDPVSYAKLLTVGLWKKNNERGLGKFVIKFKVK